MSQMVLCKLDGFTCGDVGVDVSEVERIQVVSGRNGDATQFLFEVGTVFEMVLCVTNQGQEDASHLFGNAAEDGVAGCNDGAHGVDLYYLEQKYIGKIIIRLLINQMTRKTII